VTLRARRDTRQREDRDPDARLFAASGADALRTSIAKAYKAAGVPLFSSHDLRHRPHRPAQPARRAVGTDR
jgi:hypothetical protein